VIKGSQTIQRALAARKENATDEELFIDVLTGKAASDWH
jgi:hypothetical protein